MAQAGISQCRSDDGCSAGHDCCKWFGTEGLLAEGKGQGADGTDPEADEYRTCGSACYKTG